MTFQLRNCFLKESFLFIYFPSQEFKGGPCFFHLHIAICEGSLILFSSPTLTLAKKRQSFPFSHKLWLGPTFTHKALIALVQISSISSHVHPPFRRIKEHLAVQDNYNFSCLDPKLCYK
jgi:hypothetical protein